MPDPFSESTLVELMQRSMLRIASSSNSLETTQALLERSRKTVEDSHRLLKKSQRLAQDPFRRSWNRADL